MALKLKKRTSLPLFGVPLDELCSGQQDPTSLPTVFVEMTTVLKKYGLSCDKIFVKPGQDTTVQLLKKLYHRDGTVPLEKYSQSMTSVAWLLRTFLSELPDPLLTLKYTSTFLKTQTNPDISLKYRNFRILYNGLPAINKNMLRSILELFRLILHHRRKNHLTVNEFCLSMGPVLLGMDTSTATTQEVAYAGEVLKTLLIQYHYIIGATDEMSEMDTLPLYTKKSQRVLTTTKSRAHLLITKQHRRSISSGGNLQRNVQKQLSLATSSTMSHSTQRLQLNSSSDQFFHLETVASGTQHLANKDLLSHLYQEESFVEEETAVSITDAITSRFLDFSVRAILFEPTVRISFNYEVKIPNHMKRNIATDRLLEVHIRDRTTSANIEVKHSQTRNRRMSEVEDPAIAGEESGGGTSSGTHTTDRPETRRRRNTDSEDRKTSKSLISDDLDLESSTTPKKSSKSLYRKSQAHSADVGEESILHKQFARANSDRSMQKHHSAGPFDPLTIGASSFEDVSQHLRDAVPKNHTAFDHSIPGAPATSSDDKSIIVPTPGKKKRPGISKERRTRSAKYGSATISKFDKFTKDDFSSSRRTSTDTSPPSRNRTEQTQDDMAVRSPQRGSPSAIKRPRPKSARLEPINLIQMPDPSSGKEVGTTSETGTPRTKKIRTVKDGVISKGSREILESAPSPPKDPAPPLHSEQP